jgi:hypothetical protein
VAGVRKVSWGLAAALTLACVSCGKGPKIYPVSGKVTWNGAPAAGAAVFFRRPGGALQDDPLIMGVVGEDGSFEIVCGSLGKGAPLGEYDVLIEWKQALGRGKGLAGRARDRLQGRYADPKHPLLRATVEARTNTLPPFELKDR